MEITTMAPIPPKSNPFNHDQYHMGTKMGTNCIVMYENHDTAECNYLIIINTETGERIRVALTSKGAKPSLAESIIS